MARPLRVCVVGAGPAGLAALKELREQGLEAEAFEAAPALGGVFHRCVRPPSARLA